MTKIKCPKCGADNILKASFCNECAASLDDAKVVCPNCGALNERKAKFCMHCAAKLSKESPKNEENLQAIAVAPIAEEINQIIDKASDSEDNTGIQVDVEEIEKNVQSDVKKAVNKNIAQNKTKKKGKNLIIGIGVAAIVILIGLFSLLRSPKVESIEVSYDGETSAGTVLDDKNKGIRVKGYDKDGEVYDLADWSIEKAQTLEMDSDSTVTVVYKDLTAELTVPCSTSELEEITASYSGDASEGVVLDSDNEGFTVTAHYKNGEEEIVEGWTIDIPQTLKADGTADVVIKYEDKECSLNVMCTTVTIERIKAKYSGSTKAGVKIGEGNENVTVTAILKNGEKQELTGWTVDEPVTLKEGKTSKLKIHYGEYDCVLNIECTDLSKKQYKEKCKSYTYNEIARDPDDYKGKKAKFSGKVIQCLESSDSSQVDMRLAINDDYDQIIYVVYNMPEGASRILEDDHITVYGELDGVYTYTSTMNAQITIPIMYAQYVD